MKMDNRIPVIVICGTNASGKSSLGIELAKKYSGEIISADSRQIFRGFDLCCGKVTAEERSIVSHHLLDVCDIGDLFSVSDYQKQVYSIIPQIVERGHQPFIVGGTGLYIDAITKGYSFGEETIDLDYRKELELKTIDELHEMLSSDAIQILQSNNSDFNNKRRLIRYIEKGMHGNKLDNDNYPIYDTLQIGVTWPKEMLFKRIDERLALRIEQGMIDEIEQYLNNGGNPEYLYNLGLEYKYIAWYVEGRYSSLAEFSAEMSQAIKRFAKQQIKWFKRNPDIHWVDMTNDYMNESCNLIDEFLKNQ